MLQAHWSSILIFFIFDLSKTGSAAYVNFHPPPISSDVSITDSAG